jgi:hypothetical protein
VAGTGHIRAGIHIIRNTVIVTVKDHRHYYFWSIFEEITKAETKGTIPQPVIIKKNRVLVAETKGIIYSKEHPVLKTKAHQEVGAIIKTAVVIKCTLTECDIPYFNSLVISIFTF